MSHLKFCKKIDNIHDSWCVTCVNWSLFFNSSYSSYTPDNKKGVSGMREDHLWMALYITSHQRSSAGTYTHSTDTFNTVIPNLQQRTEEKARAPCGSWCSWTLFRHRALVLSIHFQTPWCLWILIFFYSDRYYTSVLFLKKHLLIRKWSNGWAGPLG